MPSRLDRREFSGLIVMDIVAGEVAEQYLDGHEDGRQEEAHAEHDARLHPESAAQQVPGTGRRDAEGAGKI